MRKLNTRDLFLGLAAMGIGFLVARAIIFIDRQIEPQTKTLNIYTVYYQNGHTDKIQASSIDVEDNYIYFNVPDVGTVGLVNNKQIQKIVTTKKEVLHERE